MGFITKLWKDRLSAFPKRFKMTEISSDENSKIVELELQDGTVLTQGDRFNAATMNDLEQRIENAFNEASGGVTSFNDRSGAVQSQSGDYTSSQITHIYSNESTTDVQTAINNIEAEIAGISTGSLETYDVSPGQWDTTPTTGSTKPVISDGINTEIKKKLSTYANDSSSWDTTPTNGSTKPVTSGGVYSAIPALSYVGMVIHSTTLNTQAKVKAYYGGTTWIQHSGYVLRGATSGVTANSAAKTGGADSVTLATTQIPSHTHTQNAHKHKYGATYQYVAGSGSEWGYTLLKTKNADTGQGDYYTANETATNNNTGGGQAHSTVPNYKSVYIWERTV